ncbi:CSC1-like protein [Vigna angularis]|uniref:CSC1-like protein n=1 Tax=Phaseolus angularis TaxID=3914 RepID=A0A8T0JNC2_PHAAN|nr:CSC1-like protein [Vigna angularis]
MATLADIGVSATINILSAFAFLLAFALLRIQPINDRVYFPKWYLSGGRSSPRSSGNFVGKFVNLNFKTYLTFLNWMPQALRMSESEIISHAGLDSAAFLRIYTLGLKIFVPITIVALLILIPVNVSSGTLFFLKKELVVVVRNIPHMPGHAVSDSVEGFFKTNHPDHYIGHQAVYNANKFAKLAKRRERLQNWLDYYQLKSERHPGKRSTIKTGLFGLWGGKVDAVEYYKHAIKELDNVMTLERQKIIKDPKAILPVAFLSFNSRWGASVCAQTQQSKNPTLWLTDWAPEPRDVYWRNLAIPFVSLSIRRLVISLSVFALVFFYMIPIAFVQSLANLDGLEKVAPFLRPVIELIPRTIGVSIPMKATFFITYIMVDGWAGIAGEILRLKPLVIYHLKNMFIVKTERDRGKAMNPGSVDFPETIPSLQLYFLLGIVYAVVTPILLPFILVFFAFAYLVYRHQIINVYNQQYESAAAFWPLVHSRIIASMLISQFLLLGLLSTKKAAKSTPLLVILPILTFAFHKYCQRRFEPAFRKYPIEEAMSKDMLEKSTEPDLNIKAYLADAYLHPIFRSFEVEEEELIEVRVDKHQTNVAAASSPSSEPSSPSPPHHLHQSLPAHHLHLPSPPHHLHEPSPPDHLHLQSPPPHHLPESSSPPHHLPEPSLPHHLPELIPPNHHLHEPSLPYHIHQPFPPPPYNEYPPGYYYQYHPPSPPHHVYQY